MGQPDKFRSMNRAFALACELIPLSMLSRLLAAFLACVCLVAVSAAQSTAPRSSPYASMNRDSVTYRGPGRATLKDLPGDVITIGIVLPLQGKHAAEGNLLRQAAQIALDDELSSGLPPAGYHLAVAFRDESERWGQASSEMVQLIEQDHAVALITSIDGNIAHQAEQIANKIGIPVLTLSSDATTTRINIPWIFRLSPSDFDQARLMALNIYQQKKLQRVLLLAQDDHDGRVGANEFMRAADQLDAASPERVDFNPASPDLASLVDQLKSKQPEAVVLWASTEQTARLLPALQQVLPAAPIYLSSKAAEFDRSSLASCNCLTISLSSPDTPHSVEFAARYRLQTGLQPTLAAFETYDAVRLIAVAVRDCGPNRARVRDYFASGSVYPGVSGTISFDKAGNLQGEFALQGLVAAAIRAAF